MLKPTVTEDCIQCGACVDICPEVFDIVEGEIAHPKVETVPEGLEDSAREACEACPTDAIILEEV